MKLYVNGVANAIVGATTFNTSTKEYAITPTATLVAADVVLVELYDAANAVACAQVGNKFYRGTTGNVVTVA